MATQKEDAISVLGESAAELIEELEKLAQRSKTKSRASGGMLLKAEADNRAAMLEKVKELRRQLDRIEAELVSSDFSRKWGNNQPKPKQHRVRVWDTGEGGRLS